MSLARVSPSVQSGARVVVLAYVACLTVFLPFVLAQQRDYQDSWILDGIFWPTVALVVLGVLAAFSARKASSVALLVSSLVFALNAVPALKYDLFYGVADVPEHFSMVRSIVEDGSVPTGMTYSNMPGSHLLVSTLSLVTGLSANGALKLAPAVYLSPLPLIAYLIASRCSRHEDLRRAVVLAAAFPAFGFFWINFKGTTSGAFLLLLLVSLLFARETEPSGHTRVAFSLASIITVFAIPVHHAVTSLFALGVLLCLTLVLFVNSKAGVRGETMSGALSPSTLYVFSGLAVVLTIGWWMYQADFIFRIFVTEIRDIVELAEPINPTVPARFGELSIPDQIRVVIVSGRATFLIPAAVSALGVAVLAIRWRSGLSHEVRLAASFGLAVLFPAAAIVMSEIIRSSGSLESDRFASYAVLASPVPAGVAIRFLGGQPGAGPKGGASVWRFIATGAVAGLFVIYLLGGFAPQPLVPSATAVSSDLAADQPIGFFHEVNSSYQAHMISFVEEHRGIRQFLAADLVTRKQIPAFGSRDMGSRIRYPSYLEARQELDASGRWELLLLHWPGRGGPLFEKAELRTRQRIDQIADARTHNVIYDNGASFVVWRSAM
jgi:hypothetical protein